MAEEFSNNDSVLVLLGDNIFNYDLKKCSEDIRKKSLGSMIFGVRMPTKSGQYGVIEIDSSGRVLTIEEKPAEPKSNIAQTGIYMYDHKVFEYIKN